MSKERAAQLIDAGIWLRLSGDLEGARKLFERAVKLDPANERAAQLLQEGPVQPPPPSSPSGSSPFEAPESVAPAVAPVISSPSTTSTTPAATEPTTDPSVAVTTLTSLPPEEMDWGRATGFESPAPFANPSPKPSNPDDWGSMLEPPELPPNPAVTSSTSSTISIGSEPDGPPVRSTPPIYGGSSAQKSPALVVTLDGAAPPPSPIRATPPQFTEPPPPARPAPPQAEPAQSSVVTSPMEWKPPSFVGFEPPASTSAPGVTVTLTDANAPTPSPPRSTPPLFEATPEAPFPTAAPSPPKVPSFSKSPIPVAPVPTNVDVPLTAAPDPVGVAWAWSSNSPAPFRDPATAPAVVPAENRLMPTPTPSPLSPNATSAWDARSNPGIKLAAIVGEDKALEMLSSDSSVRQQPSGPAAKDEVKTLLRGARDLLDLDDHTGAMELIVKAQAMAPDDPDVKALRERSEKTLLTMFESKLGKIETIPRVLLKEDEIIWLNLDHRAGFVLAQIDGTVSFDDLFAVSGMSRLDTARILAQLVDEGVINKG